MSLPEHTTGERRTRRSRVLVQALIGAAILVFFIGAAWYLTSDQFRDWVRGRVVARLEEATGGRVEMARFRWDLARLQFVAEDVTIHGLEPPGEAPYVHADRVIVNAKIMSLGRREIGLRYLGIERPVIHVIVYPDGHTNQPTPRVSPAPKPVQQLFALQVDKAEIHNGTLLVNDRPLPLDISADDLSAHMNYAPATRRYEGSVSAGRVRTAYQDWRSFDSAAAAEFSVTPNQLDIKSLRLSSGLSALELTGQAVDFAQPRATLNYHLKLNLAEMAELARMPQLRRGVVEVTGNGTYAAGDFRTSGKVIGRDLEYRDRTIRLPALNGGAEFTADKNSVSLPHLFANVLGGTVVGSAEVKDWSGAGQRGVARLRVSNVAISRAVAALPAKTLPLDKLRPAGSASGTVDVSWRGSPSRASAAFALTVAPPAQAAPNELPVTAKMRGTYSVAGQAAEFDELNVAAGSLHLNGSGRMASRSSLRFTLNAGNMRDLYPLLASLKAEQQLPAGIQGSGSFTGTLSGRVREAEVAGRLTLTNFDIPVPLKRAAGDSRPPRLVHFDSFSADIRYSPSQVVVSNAVLRRGAEQANFGAMAGLEKGKLLDSSPITATVNVRNFSVADLQALAGFEVPVTGVLNATVQVGGTPADPRGSGRMAITKATLYGEPMQAIDADVMFAQQEAQANHIVMAHNGARVTGNAAYNLRSTAFRFDLTGVNFNLSQFRRLQTQKLTLGGLLSFHARGSGSRGEPAIDADLQVHNLVMNGEQVGNVEATAATSAGVMRIHGRSNFQSADLVFEGAVAMHDRFPANLKLTMQHLDVDPLLKTLLKGQVTGHSSVGGVVTLSGPLRDPRLLTVNGDISQLSADIQHLRIENDGPLRFSVADQVLRLDEFHLKGEDTNLGATGTVALAGGQAMNLRAEGHVQMKLLQSLNADLRSSGVTDFNIVARGTIAHPRLLGRATISKGALAYLNFPNGLSEMNGTLTFNQDRMQIESMTATSGGGNLTFGGFVTYGNGLGFNVSAAGKNVRLRYPQGMSSTVDTDLRLTGSTAAATLAGTVTVTRFSMSPQFDIAQFIAKSKQAPEAANPASLLNNLRLGVRVTSTPDLQVTTTLAKVSGDVDFNVRGTAARPVPLGRINITEGQVTFNGTTYQMDRGDVSFSNPVRIEPVVDMEMTTRVRDYDITLGFHGPGDRLSMTYRSDPPLPTADIISLLAFGTTREESLMTTGPNPTFSESASNAILGQALSSAQNSRVQRLFGVSRVKIAPEVSGTESNPNARVTIEQQVSKNFTVTYITDLTRTSSQQQIIQVEYSYSRNISVLASRDQFGIVSFDVRIRQRKK